MNREQAKQLLPIIQAFVGGAEVQSQGCITGDWYIINDPDFNPATKWRIKLKQQAEHDMDAVVGRSELSAERECIRRIETQLGAIDAMIADTRAIIEDYKRTHA